MDENGAQESGMDFYAQFNSLKALEKKFLKSNHRFFLNRTESCQPSQPNLVFRPAGFCTADENQWLDFKNFFFYALRLSNWA